MLPRIAAGEFKLALAAYEPAGRYALSHVATRANRSATGWQLSGLKAVVLDAPSADAFIVSTREGGASDAADGVTLQLNTLGDGESREAWRSALVDYFRAHAAFQ